MLLERYSAFVQRKQFGQADAVLDEGMMSAIADNRREVFALLAALRSVLRDNRGQGRASLRYAELALLADPLNAMASQMCVYQYLAEGKVNLAAMTAIFSKELRGRDITVNAMGPGPTATDLFFEGKTEGQIDAMLLTTRLFRSIFLSLRAILRLRRPRGVTCTGTITRWMWFLLPRRPPCADVF